MEMNLRMGINCKPRLLPIVYKSLQSFTEFKGDIHRIYIRACKDLTKQWRKLAFLAIDDVIFNILETWSLEWGAPNIIETEKSVAQTKKDEAKLRIAQLTEKRRKDTVAAKVWVAQGTVQIETGQEKATVVAQEAVTKAY